MFKVSILPKHSKKNNHSKALIGNYTRNYVQIDFDNMKFDDVFKICLKAKDQFNLEGFLIAKSSNHHYHAVFNKYFRKWENVVKVMSWIALISDNPNIRKYVLLQFIRKESTLRLSDKREKPKPRIIITIGKTDKGIENYKKHKALFNMIKMPCKTKKKRKRKKRK